ncbi:MAG: CPBP family intramembrane glutamic endopeptidase [Myxococcota bacterium]
MKPDDSDDADLETAAHELAATGKAIDERLGQRVDDDELSDELSENGALARVGEGSDLEKANDQTKPDNAAPTGFLDYLKTRHDPLTSLVLTIPVFLTYHLGILAIDLRNGADIVSNLLLQLSKNSIPAYIGVTLGYTAILFAVVWFLRRRGKIRPARILPVIAESTVLAILMLVTVGWATGKVFANQVGGEALGPLESIVMAAGAGFHEELVFRVGLFAGGAWLLLRTKKLPTWAAWVVAAVVSSLLFSSVHYIGSLADAFTFQSFFFRALAGVFLAAVYKFRGFAVAVYTHTIYDVFVFFF